MNYIHFSYETPILQQLPHPFTEAAILLNPFIQMPNGWTENKRKSQYEHIYPELEESLQLGIPVQWSKVMADTGIHSYEEMAIALKTSISAFRKEYARPDLANILNKGFPEDLYYPREDNISELLISDILEIFVANGSHYLLYSDPIFDKEGKLEIESLNELAVCELAPQELVITDENMDYAFLSVYDSFITILLSKEQKIKEIIKQKNWEAIICGPETYISWYYGKI